MYRLERILHLEDDPRDAVLVRAALEGDGIDCEVINVSTRADFISALERGDIDLVLSDFALPSFDGLSALALARQMTPDTPFILVSGTMGEEAAIESLRNGATDYVLKHRLIRLAPAVRRAVEEATERWNRRAAEEALERERRFLRAVLDNLDSGVVACDQNGILTLFNRATRELHGLPEQPLPPEQWAAHYSLYHADGKTPLETEAIPLHRAMRGEHLHQAEVAIRRQDGSLHVVVCSGQPIIDEHDRKVGAVVTMQDVTERRQLEHQFRQAQKMEAMGRLAAGVAHDFNNLLTVITGYCQFGRLRLAPEHPVHRDLDEIARAGEQAANLTRQLLAFSRQQMLEPRVLDLNTIVGAMAKMLKRLIGADVELVFIPAKDLGQVKADAGQIEQVLLNLIVNARDAIGEGGRITVETANLEVVELDSQAARNRPAPQSQGNGFTLTPSIEPGRYVVLTVVDTGCGMDAETGPRIFEPFFTTKGAGRGTGLGLSTVHGIVNQSEGHIGVESSVEGGTRFTIYLPRVSGAAAATRAAPDGPPGTGSESILVVDDDTALLGLVSEILRLNGYAVVTAPGGEGALAALEGESTPIDAIVTDVVMPRISGRELAERVHARHPQLPILFMSGYVGENVEALESLLGSRVGFIQKPFTPDALLRRLREVLDGRAAEAA